MVDEGNMEKSSPTEATVAVECRACLQGTNSGAVSYNIFQPWAAPWIGQSVNSTIAEDLATLAKVEISESDPHSKIICETCCQKLNNACKFVLTVQKSNEIFQQRVVSSNDASWPKPIQLDKNVNGFGNQMEIEIKQEVLSDDGCEESYRPDLALDIKIEPEEIVEPAQIKITVNGTISLEQMNASDSVIVNGCEEFGETEYLESVMKDEPVSDDDIEQPSDLPLECLLCCKDFQSVSGLKAHVIAQHSYKSVKRKMSGAPSPVKKKKTLEHICTTCRRKFETLTDLMVHETIHTKWVCYGCNENFPSFRPLSLHRKRCKAANAFDTKKPITLKDVLRPLPENAPLKCTDCDEQFTDSYYMKIHNEIHHSAGNTESETNDILKTEPEISNETDEQILESIFGKADNSDGNTDQTSAEGESETLNSSVNKSVNSEIKEKQTSEKNDDKNIKNVELKSESVACSVKGSCNETVAQELHLKVGEAVRDVAPAV